MEVFRNMTYKLTLKSTKLVDDKYNVNYRTAAYILALNRLDKTINN